MYVVKQILFCFLRQSLSFQQRERETFICYSEKQNHVTRTKLFYFNWINRKKILRNWRENHSTTRVIQQRDIEKKDKIIFFRL